MAAMTAETIPFNGAHGVRLALAFGIPALVPLGFATAAPAKSVTALAAAALCIVIGVLAIGVLLLRRSVEIAGEELRVRHGFYSWRIGRTAIGRVETRELAKARDLPLSLKRNGVAIFGLYSGWFYGARGEDVFCAVSAQPVFVFRFSGVGKSRTLAISCSSAMAAAITAWSSSAPA